MLSVALERADPVRGGVPAGRALCHRWGTRTEIARFLCSDRPWQPSLRSRSPRSWRSGSAMPVRSSGGRPARWGTAWTGSRPAWSSEHPGHGRGAGATALRAGGRGVHHGSLLEEVRIDREERFKRGRFPGAHRTPRRWNWDRHRARGTRHPVRVTRKWHAWSSEWGERATRLHAVSRAPSSPPALTTCWRPSSSLRMAKANQVEDVVPAPDTQRTCWPTRWQLSRGILESYPFTGRKVARDPGAYTSCSRRDGIAPGRP